MGNVEFYKVRASLVLASYGDIYYKEGKLLENRMFFVCDDISRKFIDTYTIPASDEWEKSNLFYGIRRHMLYKLSEVFNNIDFQFNLIVRRATDHELFDSPKWLKINSIYYLLNSDNMITGPFFVNEMDDFAHFHDLIAKGSVYTPNRKQLFEPYKIQQSA